MKKSVLRSFKIPHLRLIRHTHQHANNLVEFSVKRSRFVFIEVFTFDCKLQPDLSLCRLRLSIRQLTLECRFVASLSPSLRNICANRSRRPPNLVCQRIPFFSWKRLGTVKHVHRSYKRPFIHRDRYGFELDLLSSYSSPHLPISLSHHRATSAEITHSELLRALANAGRNSCLELRRRCGRHRAHRRASVRRQSSKRAV
jgi:hypothetical protein